MWMSDVDGRSGLMHSRPIGDIVRGVQTRKGRDGSPSAKQPGSEGRDYTLISQASRPRTAVRSDPSVQGEHQLMA